MRTITKLNVGLFLGTLIAFGTGGSLLAFGHGDDDDRKKGERPLRAWAHIQGPGISGMVRFTQKSVEREQPTPPVLVEARVKGLRGPKHGFHIHETGACEPTFAAAGGHHDPGPSGNSDPDANHPYHLGDLPNLVVKGRVGRLKTTTSRIVLQADRPLSIFDQGGIPLTNGPGSAVIVHANEDRGDEGPPGRPGPPGHAGGARIACGVIMRDRDAGR